MPSDPDSIRTIKIGPMIYEIRRVHDLRDGDQPLWGQAKISKSEIRIDESLDSQQTKQTLWHEILHVILIQAGMPHFKRAEQFIEALAYGILNVIQDNPWILDEKPIPESSDD